MGVAIDFRGETFAYIPKTTKFAKVFSLESFPLYSMCSIKKNMRLTVSSGYLTNSVYMCMMRVKNIGCTHKTYDNNITEVHKSGEPC